MLEDLRKFLLRGNVIDLAVAIIIGIAFGAVITSLVNDVIMAIVGAIFGKPNFDDLTFSIGDGIVYYGRFLTAVLNFLIIGTSIFVVVRIAEQLFKKDEESKPTEVDLLTEIRDELRARPGDPGEHDELVARQFDIDVLEVVLACAAHDQRVVIDRSRLLARGGTHPTEASGSAQMKRTSVRTRLPDLTQLALQLVDFVAESGRLLEPKIAGGVLHVVGQTLDQTR